METINITKTEVLSDNWYILRKITYEHQHPNGPVTTQSREAYDRGNGATILLYNKAAQTIILTRQFRMPTYLNGNKDGYLVECCGGLLEWLALPLLKTAGSKKPGDEIYKEISYPVAHRLLTRCDAVLRIEGESSGADKDVEVARGLGLPVYYKLEDIPGQ